MCRIQTICIIGLAFTILSLRVYSQDTTSRKEVKVYTSMRKALRHPEKVLALDLSGQNLRVLPKDIARLQNLELLILGPRRRNLWLYPKAWPYKFFGKPLPAGGYAHLQGRGAGRFIYRNYIDSLPNEFYALKNLKFIDAANNSFADTVTISKIKSLYPDIIILSYSYKTWNLVEAEFRKAEKYLEKYKLK